MATTASIVYTRDMVFSRTSVALDGGLAHAGSYLIDYIQKFGIERTGRDLVLAAETGWVVLGAERARSLIPEEVCDYRYVIDGNTERLTSSSRDGARGQTDLAARMFSPPQWYRPSCLRAWDEIELAPLDVRTVILGKVIDDLMRSGGRSLSAHLPERLACKVAPRTDEIMTAAWMEGGHGTYSLVHPAHDVYVAIDPEFSITGRIRLLGMSGQGRNLDFFDGLWAKCLGLDVREAVVEDQHAMMTACAALTDRKMTSHLPEGWVQVISEGAAGHIDPMGSPYLGSVISHLWLYAF